VNVSLLDLVLVFEFTSFLLMHSFAVHKIYIYVSKLT